MENIAASAAGWILVLVVLPLWITAGLADYFVIVRPALRRRQAPPELILHLVQFAPVGLPVTAALFLRINAGYFLFAFAFLVVHHIVAAVDLFYANPKRRIAPREQMVHSFLEIMPLTACLLLGVCTGPSLWLFWAKALKLRSSRLPSSHCSAGLIVVVLAAAFFLNFLPYLEELWRCLRNPQGT